MSVILPKFWNTLKLYNKFPENIGKYVTNIRPQFWSPLSALTRGMLLLTKAKRPLKFKTLCGFNKHAVKLRMHKAAPYAFPIRLNTFRRSKSNNNGDIRQNSKATIL